MLRRNKGYGFLNIAGLTVGIVCAALILLWVEDELTYNKFPNSEHLFAIFENQTYSGKVNSFKVAPGPLAAVLKDEVAGVKNVMRVADGNIFTFEIGDKKISESGSYIDASVFSMLDVKFTAGDAATAFDVAQSIVISETMARKFFGTENPLGQILKIDNRKDHQVTGVYADIRKNSDFEYHWMMPFSNLEKEYEATMNVHSWGNNWMYLYVELEPAANLADVNEQIYELLPQKTDGSVRHKLFLYPLSRLKLYGNFVAGKETGDGYISTVRMFAGIAGIILLIACINFMNLATARSQKRALEVGVRKTFGARRRMLLSQFMVESAWITLLALVASVLIIVLVLPSFNTLVGKQLTLGLGNPVHWLGLLGVGGLCCLLAGSYPAFYLSSFPPIDVLRRLITRSGSEAWFRKGLVVFQFAVSLILIICTAFIYLQIQHTRNRSLGMDIAQVLTINASDDIKKNYAPIKQELISTGMVDQVALSSQQMIQLWNNGGGYNWPGKPDDVNPLVSHVVISSGLLSTLGMEIVDGHDFDTDDSEANGNYVIINETLAGLMGDEGRVGGRINQGGGDYNEVIAIVNDFVFNSVYRTNSAPVIMWCYPQGASYLFVRIKAGNTQAALDKIGGVIRQFDPGYSFEYRFMDDRFDRMFRSEQLTGKLSMLFAALAIFISCLGLFGLSAFSAEQRTREIGIRKVLGASVWGITVQLGRNFVILVLMSFVVAIPVAWWIMHDWLQRFPYHVNTSWAVFAVACLLVIVIAILTVSFQSIKAATANPIKAIKAE